MNRRQASRAAAKALFVCLGIAPTIEQIDTTEAHLDSFAVRQACGEWTVSGDGIRHPVSANGAEEAVS
jgi:hypothetical protein